MTVHQKTALVTGAGGGVGGKLVRSLVAQGWKVLAVVRSYEDAAELNAIDGIEAFKLDLLHTDALLAWASELALREQDGIDLLVHAAATATVGKADQATATDWQHVLSTNVTAPALLTAGLLPVIRQVKGTIVFINSGAGERAVANHSIYAASKHALRGYADTLRLEESEHQVRVSTVYPGQINTKMLRAIDNHLGVAFTPESYIDPQTVANTVIWIAQATPDVHITNVDLRPRQELSAKFNV
ncbi:MAG: SDR family oxidoreductase [Bifidobacterium sp.]|jgi:NADP-dependent 3-hydroxy acid dehydrogenase YdfG|nr:SDR family oxidoreductase [Bifidobacterium sp.]MCH4175647.1 SDR family oxidoreductase [Bifidobacterium sp.]